LLVPDFLLLQLFLFHRVSLPEREARSVCIGVCIAL
jgi:hypothetical protein